MKARPILFNGPMVRALLEGRKTQTRRIAKPRQAPSLLDGSWSDSYVLDPRNREWLMLDCPYGKPGDLLWVRETWAEGWTYAGERPAVFYRSTMDGLSHCQHILNCDKMLGATAPSEGMKWRPSIHMPRWASRLTLRITDVRVQRLQEISEADAEAEGVRPAFEPNELRWQHYSPHGVAYARLWESIKPGSWDANPWVWALSFEVIHKNAEEVMQ